MIEMFTQIFIISALVIFGMALLVCLVRLIVPLLLIELYHLMPRVLLLCLLLV